MVLLHVVPKFSLPFTSSKVEIEDVTLQVWFKQKRIMQNFNKHTHKEKAVDLHLNTGKSTPMSSKLYKILAFYDSLLPLAFLIY